MIKEKDVVQKGEFTQAVILCGLPGSGKSTFVKEYCPDYVQISRDIIRYELGYVSDPDEKARLTKEQEKEVTEVEYRLIEKCLDKKLNFVVDDTNASEFYRTKLLDFIRRWNDVYIVGVNFTTPVNVCVKRRKNQIPAEVIYNMAERMKPIKKTEVDELIEM